MQIKYVIKGRKGAFLGLDLHQDHKPVQSEEDILIREDSEAERDELQTLNSSFVDAIRDFYGDDYLKQRAEQNEHIDLLGALSEKSAEHVVGVSNNCECTSNKDEHLSFNACNCNNNSKHSNITFD